MASTPRKPTTVFGYNLCLSGALVPAVMRRIEELKSENISRYITELATFDMRRLRAHSLTRPLARKPLIVQHAIDLAIDRHYVVGGKKSNKEEMDRLIRRGPNDAAALGDIAPVKKVKFRLWLRCRHREAMLQRAASLGFRSLGEYFTSLIRFDLLLGGPHNEFPGDKQFDRAEIAGLDDYTLDVFHANEPRKCMVDYAVEEAAGRELSPEERDAELAKVAEQLCEHAVQSHKSARRAGK
jgi:hypothetical protein